MPAGTVEAVPPSGEVVSLRPTLPPTPPPMMPDALRPLREKVAARREAVVQAESALMEHAEQQEKRVAELETALEEAQKTIAELRAELKSEQFVLRSSATSREHAG